MKIIFKKHLIFFLVLVVCLVLRIYRLDVLTTFGHDQGIDFLTVRDMIQNRHLTLIGIKVSFAQFFQGPLYLYILLPFFLFMKMNPLSGAVASIVMSMITICLLYFTLVKLENIKAGIIGSLIFAVSPQFIKYGNTPLYQHFVPLFVIVSVYFLFKSSSSSKIYLIILLGIFIGLSIEVHFLSFSLFPSALIYLIRKKNDKLKTALSFLTGIIVGISPTIIFESRHDFLNTHHFLQYVNSAKDSEFSLTNKFMPWLTGSANFFGGENYFLGGFFICLVIFILFNPKKRLNQKNILIQQFTLLLLIIYFIFCLTLPNFSWWYPLPFWICSLMITAIYFSKDLSLLKILLLLIILIFNLRTSLINLKQNHGYYMPEGWTLKKIKETCKIINLDAVGEAENFNVASLLDGDTRAYPLRYTLVTADKNPGAVTDYNQNNVLYVVNSGDVNKVINSQTWELIEFSPYRLVKTWDMGEGIFLYRLDRSRKEI